MEVLIIKAKKHDKEAFSQLIRIYEADMYKIAKAILKNDEDVSDAMQETILTCWEKIHTLKYHKYFKTWLIKVLINKSNAIYNQRKRFVSEMYAEESSVLEDEYSNVEWKEFFNHLDEKYRVVVMLYYVEGFKVKEVAQILEISESTVKARLCAARKKMEKDYQGERRFKAI